MKTLNQEVLTQVELEFDEVYALRRISDGKYLSSKLDGFRELMVGDTIYLGNIDTRTRNCWFEWDAKKYPFIFAEPMEVVSLQVTKTVVVKSANLMP